MSCLPVLVLGMGTALAHMLREDAAGADQVDGRSAGPVGARSTSRPVEDQPADQPDRHRDQDEPDQDQLDQVREQRRARGRTNENGMRATLERVGRSSNLTAIAVGRRSAPGPIIASQRHMPINWT